MTRCLVPSHLLPHLPFSLKGKPLPPRHHLLHPQTHASIAEHEHVQWAEQQVAKKRRRREPGAEPQWGNMFNQVRHVLESSVLFVLCVSVLLSCVSLSAVVLTWNF